MNFKTTILLIVLLIIVGVGVYFVQTQPARQVAQTTQKNLLNISEDEVQKVQIIPADGQPIAIQRKGADWEIIQPVHAKADTFTAGDLVREICSLQSHAQVGSDVATGVDQPSYRVELTDKDGKITKLAVGEKSGVGDNLYVRVDDNKKTDVVSADLETYLTKSLNDYRDMNLVSTSSTQIDRLTLEHAGRKIALVRKGAQWEMVSPDHWSVDSSQMEDLLTALTSLRAVDFVDKPAPASSYQFNDPSLVVTYSVAPLAATSRPTTEPAAKKIVFGRYEDILKRNVFADVNGTIVKIAASSMDSLNKTPLDLRDRQVVDIDSAKVEKIELIRDLPATTQPTKRAASKADIVIARNTPPTHPATTRPTTKPTTHPTTEPATNTAPKWVFPTDKSAEVDDANVNDLLASLHPLRAEKYLEKLPATLPSDRFTLHVWASGKEYSIKIYSTPAGDENGIAVYDQSIFELPVTFVDHLKLSFKQP